MSPADEPSAAAVPCPPCSGTGKLISGLGGTPHEVTCPWCEGTGAFRSEHDTQAAGPAET